MDRRATVTFEGKQHTGFVQVDGRGRRFVTVCKPVKLDDTENVWVERSENQSLAMQYKIEYIRVYLPEPEPERQPLSIQMSMGFTYPMYSNYLYNIDSDERKKYVPEIKF